MKSIKLIKRFLPLYLILLINGCSVLEQAQQYERFTQCKFSLGSVEIIEVGGIDISNLTNIEEMGMINMLSLGNQIMSGSLPAKLRINLKARNNNDQKAAIAGMDWQIMLKESEFLNGDIGEYIEVLPNASTSIPINTNFDLVKMVESNALDQLLTVVFAKDKKQAFRDLGVKLRIKPYYRLGEEVFKYPGLIDIPL